MKKLFFLLAAVVMAVTANAKVINGTPNGDEKGRVNYWVNGEGQAAAGDTIVLADGVYNESTITINKDVVIMAAEGAKPVINIVSAWGCAKLTDAASATFDGITFNGNDSVNYLIAVTGSEVGKLTITNCEFKNWIYWAVSNQFEAAAHVDSVIIDNCLFHDGAEAAISFSDKAPEGKHSVQYFKLTNSTFYNIKSTEYRAVVQVNSNGEATGLQNEIVIDHITLANYDSGELGAISSRKSSNLKISNSIIYSPVAGESAFYIYGGTVDNTLYFNGTAKSGPTYTNCLTVDPMFVDAANGNFALAEGSPALGAGTDGSNLGDPRWNAPAVEEEYEVMDITMTNLVVEEMEGYLVLTASDDDNTGLNVMLALNADGTVSEMSYAAIVAGWNETELPILEGKITKTYSEELATDVYSGLIVVEYMGGKLGVNLTMYAVPVKVVDVVVNDATITVEELPDGVGGTYELINVSAKWNESTLLIEGIEKEFTGFVQIKETFMVDGEEDWYIWMGQKAVVTTVDNVLTVTGEFKNNFTGDVYNVTISGKLPVVEEPEVEKPEPTYTENKLNPYAFGLESTLSADKATLNVTYRLNNSNATSVNVVVYNGEEKVATIPGTTAIGVNTVEVATADLPGGVELTWAVEVNGTSVAAPTLEEKIYSFYHPSGVDIDNNPENATFGMLLVNEAMQSVASKTEGYVSAGFGAGIFAFTPSFDLIPNGELPGYNGGKTFSTVKNDFAPRRIRISEDGRIFATAQDGSGEYLWEINPENLNDWTTVFQGTNDGYTLKDADGNFIAGTNSGFDVRGEGENLQLLMLSASLPGAQVGSFKCHTYDLGAATTWATAPTKEIPGANYMLVTNQSNAQFDKDGGVWYIQYRGTTTESEPGLVHINKDGVEDLKQLRHYTRNAGFRFTDDFSKVIIAGVTDGSNVKKATIYAVSQDENGAPVLTEETVIETSVLGSNLNDFAWDYAGNLYGVSNSNEKLAAWAMPYSGTVETPAAAKYAFQLPEPLKMAGVVKRAVQNGDEVIVLTHEEDGTAHIYQVVNGKARVEISQEGVIARDPENAGDLLAISDIALTEDGKLVATNYMITQSADDQVVEGDKRGETRVYLWNDLAGDPSVLFTSKMSSNWFQSKQGLTMAVKGTSADMEIFMTGIHKSKAWARVSSYRVIDGVYTEPDVNHNDHYYFYDINDAVALETTVGTQYELNASPLGKMNWILDANLINPVEIVEPETNNVEIASCVALTEDLGKKFNGASYVTVGEQVLMVAPFATPEGKLIGVEILDITNGLAGALYVDMLYLDDAVEAAAAATAVKVVEGEDANSLVITLVADATLYTLEAELAGEPEYQVYEDEITNLVIDLDNLLLIGGPSSAFQVEVVLALGEYNMSEDKFQLLPTSSVTLLGTDATFVEGYASVDGIAQTATAVVRVQWNGMFIELHLTMSAAPMEATVVVVENATVEVEKYVIFGDMYDYALKMTGVWTDTTDNTTYPVLVEVPVYYPEATEPSTIFSTVTVGGNGDNDPWLGFGEGDLTITTVDGVVTATGIVQNPLAGVAFDITISGKLPETAVDNIQVGVKATKVVKNGQLVIIKGDVEYNAQGAVIK